MLLISWDNIDFSSLICCQHSNFSKLITKNSCRLLILMAFHVCKFSGCLWIYFGVMQLLMYLHKRFSAFMLFWRPPSLPSPMCIMRYSWRDKVLRMAITSVAYHVPIPTCIHAVHHHLIGRCCNVSICLWWNIKLMFQSENSIFL